MSLLYAVIFASRCRSNHHRLALDALRHLRSDEAEHWRNLLLHYHDDYLKGAKAPDDTFKDFKNHVLHVRDNDWGGAISACEEWYRRTVRALAAKDWRQAAWSAGVLSHYYCDPIQPFHTHQTEEEGVIHRAVEWSFSKSYGIFQKILEARGGYPQMETPASERWLAEMVRAGAQASTQHYELIIDHYDLAVGVKDPPAGLDQDIREAVAGLIGHAAVGFSRILDRAFAEAAVAPPKIGGALQAFFLALEAPVQAVLKLMDDAAARKEVQAQFQEFQRTGKVRATLGEDDKVVRALYAAEVLNTPLSSLDAQWPREIGTQAKGAPKSAPKPAPKAKARPKPAPKPKHAPKAVEVEKIEPAATIEDALKAEKEPKRPRDLPEGAPRAKDEKSLPRYTLDGRAPVEKAPSIGPKTARRLEAVGVRTIADLLAASPDEKQTQINVRHISAQVIRDWQAQALLACTVPGLRSREAQALVACGVRDAGALKAHDALALCEAIAEWGLSEEGQRAWGTAAAPTPDDIATWIARAERAAMQASEAA